MRHHDRRHTGAGAARETPERRRCGEREVSPLGRGSSSLISRWDRSRIAGLGVQCVPRTADSDGQQVEEHPDFRDGGDDAEEVVELPGQFGEQERDGDVCHKAKKTWAARMP